MRPTLPSLPSANQKVDPIETPWSRSAAVKRVAEIASGGVVEPAKNIVDIARSLVATAIDPAQKDWWSRRVNTLDQLEVISATRGLTAEETVIKERILKEITEAAQKPSSLAINVAPYSAPGAAMTPGDYASAMARALAHHSASERKLAGTAQTPQTPQAQTPQGQTPQGQTPQGQTPQVQMSGTSLTPPTLPSFTTSQHQAGPPSPTLAPVALHFPPSTPSTPGVLPKGSQAVIPAAGNPPIIRADIGPPTVSTPVRPGSVLVEIDQKEDRSKLVNLMIAKYPFEHDYAIAKFFFEKAIATVSGRQRLKAKQTELNTYIRVLVYMGTVSVFATVENLTKIPHRRHKSR